MSPEASTEFFRSKARGDAILAKAPCDWVILRPTLVLAPDAYGGTALLRGAAALPGVLPEVLPGSHVQTVHIDDLVTAVVASARGGVPSGTIADVTGPDAHSLPELIGRMRRWLGLPEARLHLPIPDAILTVVTATADLAGRLGWRSPLRSSAIAVLRDDVQGDPAPWVAAGETQPRDLDATLASLPATRQERLHARLYVAVPLAIAVLSVFWTATGVLTLASPVTAAAVLVGGALPAGLVTATVLGGAAADIALGLAILWRPWCRKAALGMIALSALYLMGGTLFVPHLWADPLGPFLKVLPGMALALFVWLAVEDR